MNYQDDFELWEEAIVNVPLNEIKTPTEPVKDFVARVETLAKDANEDREVLAGAGMDVQLIDDLTPLGGALRYCQANWMSVYKAQEEATLLWREQAPLAFEFRDELLHDFSFAYRDHSDILKKVMRIREGGSKADMVQDLIEEAVLGEKYPEPLNLINFDLTKLDKARNLSRSMAELLATANGEADEGNETKVLRDKAFTLLFEKDSTIREYGRYVFWKNDDKRSRYFR